MPLYNPDLLCPAIVTRTTVPLLSNAPSKEEASNGQTVTLTACSEYKKFAHFVGHFDVMHNLHLVHDDKQHPMIFTILKDSRFYCIHHVPGDSWKTHDITPGSTDTTATAFHVLQLGDDRVAIAVVINTPSSSGGNIQDIFYAEPFDPKSMDFDPKSIAFRKIDKNRDISPISTVNLALNKSTSSCFIVVRVAAINANFDMDFVVTPGSDEGNWTGIWIPINDTKVLKTIGVTLSGPYNDCAAMLYKGDYPLNKSLFDDPDAASCLCITNIDTAAGYYATEVNLLATGGARDFATTITPSNLSDIYVAGVKGIGYYWASNLVNPYTIQEPMVILGDISFKQVVASEKKEIDSDKSRITVFAVSTDGGLYFIEGTRNGNDALPTFEAMPIPIRRDIGFLSAQYHPEIDTSEVVYVNRKDSQVRYMLRDPTTFLWTERTVHIERGNEGIIFDAFETRVSLKGNSGTIVGADYPMMISSSELAYALINGKSYRISQKPTPVTTDSSGSVHVVIPTDVAHSSPILHFTVQGMGQSQTINVDPRQRVTYQWSKYTRGADLKNAKSATGKPIFADTSIPDSTFHDIVMTLQEVSKILPTQNSNEKTSRSERSVMANFSFGSIFSDVINGVKGAIGSVIGAIAGAAEYVADAVVNVVKSGISVINGVVNFVATIAGKAYRWILDAEGTIVSAVIACLKNTLGIDSTRFFALFGFAWDHENIVKTHKTIAEAALKGADVLRAVIRKNIPSLKGCIKGIKSNISPYVKDRRIPETEKIINWKDLSSTLENSLPGKLLKAFIDNPIVHEIMNLASKWIVKATSLLDNVISLPGAEAIIKLLKDLTEIAGNLVEREAENFTHFLNDVVAKIKDLLAGRLNMGEFFSVLFSDAFWTVFDAMEVVVDAFIDILSDLIGAVLDMCAGPIKIPAVSSFWEALNDTKFSVLNVFSMGIAQVGYLATMLWKGKLPLEIMPRWYTLFPDADSINLSTTKSEHTRIPRQLSNLNAAPAPASNSPAHDSPQSNVSPTEVLFTILSSISVLVATSLEIGNISISGNEGGPVYGDKGSFELGAVTREDAPFIDDAPSSPPETSPAPNIELNKIQTWFQMCFNGVSFVSEVVLLVIGWHSNEYNKWFKGTSLVLKGFDLIIASGKMGGFFEGRTLPYIFNFAPLLSPIGNLLNAICGFTDFGYSDGTSVDYTAFIVSLSGFAGAACDVISVVAAINRQPQVKIVFVLASIVVNSLGLGGGISVFCMKDRLGSQKDLVGEGAKTLDG